MTTRFLAMAGILGTAFCGGGVNSVESATRVGSVEGASGAVDLVNPASTGTARPMLEQAVVDGCLACHGMPTLSLEARTREEVHTAIAEIAAGRVAHPVPIPALSDEDLTALAAALAGPSP